MWPISQLSIFIIEDILNLLQLGLPYIPEHVFFKTYTCVSDSKGIFHSLFFSCQIVLRPLLCVALQF